MSLTQSRSIRRCTAVATAFLLLACDGDVEPASGRGGEATILAEIETAFFCDIPEVVDVVLRATALGCLEDDPECDLADVEGTMLTCPAASPTALLGVDLRRPGRYRLTAVAHATARDDIEVCFATLSSSAGAGDPVFALTQAQIDGAAQIQAANESTECSEN